MIAEILADLLKVGGLEAVIIYNKNNQILDSWKNAHVNIQIFEDLGLNCLQVQLSAEQTNSPFDELVLLHEKGQLYYRQHQDFFLIVLVKLQVEIALIRLLVNVGFATYDESRKLQKIIQKIPQENRNLLDKEFIDDVEEEYLNKLKDQQNN